MNQSNDTTLSVLKMLVSWTLAAISGLTASQVAIYLTILFTGLNTYVLIRDKIVRREKHDDEF
jgi:hypothetical protein